MCRELEEMGLGCKGPRHQPHQQWRVPEGGRGPEKDGSEEDSACWIVRGREWRQFEGYCNCAQGQELILPLPFTTPNLIQDYKSGCWPVAASLEAGIPSLSLLPGTCP